jgi:hypothetical protein
MSLFLQLFTLPAGYFHATGTCVVVMENTSQLVVKDNGNQVAFR